MLVEKYAKKIREADSRAFVRRVMWRSLDERIYKVFDDYAEKIGALNSFGGLKIRRTRNYEPIRSSELISSQHINSTHIWTGDRFLGVALVDREKKSIKDALETNAQLWYSQGPSGQVLVFVAPYSSNAGEIQEKEIIIGKYKEPASISISDINSHFSIFFKYCFCTSQHSASSLSNYLYRKKLMFRDFRYKSDFKSKAINVVERVAILVVGGAAVWASLYAGGKI
ncbi:hypothetical protein [Motiliproteus sp. MSK22-1]|uniref:hypothetical protein n=1 Tax=Motiliproteus sp. MSK22-1 TaxID=1897630 RepID=UPI0009765EF7|nr:hypothetical protein [Motiliproteus sp. MSK22-1]OMH30219.1 hypothetical protein BGP75_17645 [Motiliproteus sp. MSK22-1]